MNGNGLFVVAKFCWMSNHHFAVCVPKRSQRPPSRNERPTASSSAVRESMLLGKPSGALWVSSIPGFQTDMVQSSCKQPWWKQKGSIWYIVMNWFNANSFYRCYSYISWNCYLDKEAKEQANLSLSLFPGVSPFQSLKWKWISPTSNWGAELRGNMS